MLAFVIQNHPHRSGVYLTGKLVRCLVLDGSILFGSWSLRQTRGGSDEVMDWLQFYNHLRLHSTLGYLSPVNFEKEQAIRKMQLVEETRNAAKSKRQGRLHARAS